ncbi:hypothetical protein PM8797T_08179, partial [Gimesia maris DSM 8797]
YVVCDAFHYKNISSLAADRARGADFYSQVIPENASVL